MSDGPIDDFDFDKVFLRIPNRLFDGDHDLSSLSEAKSDTPLAISDYDGSPKSELTTSSGDSRYPIDPEKLFPKLFRGILESVFLWIFFSHKNSG